MGLWDKISGEFVDVIEWTDSSNDTLVYRFERYGNEIKYGAMLTVREGQAAVLVNEGQLADVFEPGLYQLETSNLPILSTLQAWAHGFESPFKAEVYFFSTRRFTDLKWGTKNPIMLRDQEFGAVRLRAFGTYTMRVKDPATLLREIVGTDGHFTTDEISDQLRNLIVSRFATALGESEIPVLDLAANYDDLGEFIAASIAPHATEYGLEVPTFLVENISLPDAVAEALDRRTSMGVVGNLRNYAAFQAAESMRDAAANPGGGAGDGLGMGMGLAMGHKMAETLSGNATPAASAESAPPPVLPQISFHLAVDDQPTGPFDAGALQQKIGSGQMTRASLVWAPGMEGWEPAGEVEGVAGLFGNVPPPIPKS